jgi:hypothetical protein
MSPTMWTVKHIVQGIQTTTSRKCICNPLKETMEMKGYKTLSGGYRFRCSTGGDHISSLGCIGEQQAQLATSLVETFG